MKNINNENSEENPAIPVEIPREVLSAEALQGIIESYILREGTDYGRQEVSHEAKIEQILRQLERGHIRIVFDPESESVTLLTDGEWQKLQRQS